MLDTAAADYRRTVCLQGPLANRGFAVADGVVSEAESWHDQDRRLVQETERDSSIGLQHHAVRDTSGPRHKGRDQCGRDGLACDGIVSDPDSIDRRWNVLARR